MPDLSNFLTIFAGIKIFCKERLYMTEKICYTIERHVSGISLAGTIKYAPVAQLDRASDSDSEGHRFDSCRVHQTSIIRTKFSKLEMGSDFFLSFCRKGITH